MALVISKFFSLRNIPYIKQFNEGLYWNCVDSIGTQFLLIVHNLLLRHFLGPSFHGIFGCSMSAFYFLLILLNLGLDASLAPFLNIFTQSRQTLRTLFKYQLAPQWAFICICALSFYFFSFYFSSYFSPSSIDLPVAIIAITFITESIRKTLKYFLQLVFFTKFAAIIEVTGTAMYVSLFWALYYLGIKLSLVHCWLLLGFVSAFQLLNMFYAFYTFYNDQSYQLHGDMDFSFYKRIAKTRFFTWGNQLTTQLLSDNFLVPLAGVRLGLEQASSIKIVTSLTRWITLLTQKVFGISTTALLAHIKNQSANIQQIIFLHLSYWLHQALVVLVVFLAINAQKIISMQTTALSINLPIIYLILMIACAESFFTLYEKWYIVEEKIHYFFIFNFLSLLLLYFIFPYFSSVASIFCFIIIVRFFIFICLSLFSYYKWQIKPSLSINYKTFVISLILSILFYFLI